MSTTPNPAASVGQDNRSYGRVGGSSRIPTNYSTLIYVRDDSIGQNYHIQAWLPPNIQVNTQSNWNAPFAAAGGDSINTLVQMVNEQTRGTPLDNITPSSIRSQKMTRSFWQGTTPIQLTLPLELRAVNSAREDVYEVWQQLTGLTLPSKKSGGLEELVPPGPTGGRYIAVAVGRFLRMFNVVVTNVSSDIRMVQDSAGLPVKGLVTVTFETDRIVTYEQWRQMTDLGTDASIRSQVQISLDKQGE